MAPITPLEIVLIIVALILIALLIWGYRINKKAIPIVEDFNDLDGHSIISEVVISSRELLKRFKKRVSGTRSLEEVCLNANPKYLWILDNGHGKLQKGKRGPKFDDGTQFEEWEFNRDIVRRIMVGLEKAGGVFFNLVPEVDVNSFLRNRVHRANTLETNGLQPIYVSIHANALGMGEWRNGSKGLECWYHPESKEGSQLAGVFQNYLMEELPSWKDRGIKCHQKDSKNIFYVLRNTNMPAVLTENGFYTDEEECRELMKDEIRQKIADAHVKAMVYIENNQLRSVGMYKPNMVIG